MITLKMEQGSDEWLSVRLGLVSASRFSDIMTEPRSKADKESGNLSDTAKSYIAELVAEIMTGEQKEVRGAALDWGKEFESKARIEYEFREEKDVDSSAGIILRDDRMAGASPDGLVGDDGMIEIKCPYNSANHIKTIISGEMPEEHKPQVQGNMWINGRKWCDFISYDPRVVDGKSDLFVKRIYRDDAYIAELEAKINNFLEHLVKTLIEKFGVSWQGVNISEIGSN